MRSPYEPPSAGPWRSLVSAGGAALALTALACTHTSDAPSDDAGADAGDAGPRITCQNDPRIDTFTANLSKPSAGETFVATILSADPAPPAIGRNTFEVSIGPPAGRALPPGDLGVGLFMPDHGHGSSITPDVTRKADGSYEITPLYFFMPGVWQVTLTYGAGDAGAPDKVQFYFCVAG